MFGLRRSVKTISPAVSCALRVGVVRNAVGSGGMMLLRMQSTTSNEVPANKDSKSEQYNGHMTEKQVDEWLQAIDSLEAEFSSQSILSDVSLTPDGKGRMNLLEEAMKSKKTFEPTKEQIEEWEALKKVPIPRKADDVLEHVTNMIMRHGKKEKARKIMSRALYLLFCATRKDPVEVLKQALDDLAPLMVVKTFKTGVAKAAVIPVPLNQKQRYRIAWTWIVEASKKKSSSDFAVRLGEELIAVHKGISSGFDKRDSLHKTAIAHRAYIKLR
ncbi:mitochondrial 37S ribosomal protein uS7m Ecym_7176 [Eremothecium cymbalariae DBVPG|uniref:Small ribosomal subunit protein uS7m n=1 Tax=Eremothecium cymbalariae (strain CBS 270.75 / DBVPG 7215 / KCTC 17166 / NRRL Y-17582) TaxID=931890 RepID=G8JW09_ERECY|nr:hypothetical protein Ecym_7176 [Eremothecium cymbalariae DBVPG\